VKLFVFQSYKKTYWKSCMLIAAEFVQDDTIFNGYE